MTETPAYLPDRAHYKLEVLAHAIAKRIPHEPSDEKGINCIRRKLLSLSRSRFDSNPKYLFRFKWMECSASLTESERVALKSLLDILPEVSHYMTNDQIEEFFEQYYKLPNRPSWEPDITSPGDRQRMHEEYEKRVIRHYEDLLTMAKEGTIRLLNENSCILTGLELTIGYAQRVAIVTKEDGIKFCKLLGIELIIEGSEKVSAESSKNIAIPAEVDKKLPKTQTSKKPRSKERKDVIAHLIENEIKNNGGNFEYKPIWLSFVKMAKDKEHPFIDYSFEKRCPVFSRANKDEDLTEKKLRVRLDRLKSKVLAQQSDTSVVRAP